MWTQSLLSINRHIYITILFEAGKCSCSKFLFHFFLLIMVYSWVMINDNLFSLIFFFCMIRLLIIDKEREDLTLYFSTKTCSKRILIKILLIAQCMFAHNIQKTFQRDFKCVSKIVCTVIHE